MYIKKSGHFLCLKKDYNGFNFQYNKQFVEDLSTQRAIKTTIQTLYDKSLLDNYANADKFLEKFSFTTTRRGDLLEQVNDFIQ